MGHLSYRLELITPAFLGNGQQESEWRVPPIKALIRQWWRIVAAKNVRYDFRKVFSEEAMLFGFAPSKTSEGKALKSPVTLSLSSWERGSLIEWPPDPRVKHPEVEHAGGQIGAHLYLGYGPLSFAAGKTALKQPPGLAPQQSVELHLKFRDTVGQLKVRAHLQWTLKLMDGFGSIGGRSRNGWGSLRCIPVEPEGEQVLSLAGTAEVLAQKLNKLADTFSRPLLDCLQQDWPHAFGMDGKGVLVWISSEPFNTWQDAMRFVAETKIALRTNLSPFERNSDPDSPVVDRRHFFGYPITNHGVLEWAETDNKGKPKLKKGGKLRQKDRLANQLRFKVHCVQGGFRVVVFHLPHRLPEALVKKLCRPEDKHWIRKTELSFWPEVHSFLDKQSSLRRVGNFR